MQTSSPRQWRVSPGTSASAPFRLRFACAAIAVLACADAMAQASAAPGASTARLDDVVVTATRFAEPAAALPLGVSVLTAEQIRASGAATVNEAIMRLLGVPGRADAYGGGDYALDLRGFGETAASNQVVVLDGIRLNEADMSGARLAGIALDTVERIEVLRGSGSVLYGENATGGVIVITTRAGAGKARRNTASASAYAGAGRYGLRELRADATLAAGGFSLDVSGAKRDADNHRENFRSEFDAHSVTGQWRTDGLRLGASHARDALDTGLPGGLSAAQYAADPRQAGASTNQAAIDNTRTTVFGEATLGPWQLGLDLGRRDKTLRSIGYGYDVEAQHQSLKARHQASFGGARNVLVLGTDHGRWDRVVPGTWGSISGQSTHAWYLKDDLTLPGSATRLSAGWRTERISKRHAASGATTRLADRQHAWELGISQPLAGSVSVYGRIGRSFRLANVDEFSFASPGTELLPQTSRDVEIGSRWAHRGGHVEARLYRSELDREIGYNPAAPGPWGAGANVNYDPTRRQGLELDATHALSRTLELSAHAGLRDASFRSGPYAGKEVPWTPARTLALRASWQPADGHRLSGGVNRVSGQHPGGDFDNACRMPAYTTADARYAYQWQQAELALGVTNLFDSRYYTQAYGCSGSSPGGIYPEAGRALTASMRLRF